MASRLINGLVLVVLGAVLLMNTMGYLPWTVWDAAWSYWPVLLVGLGLQIALTRWRFPGLALAIVAILILGAMNPYTRSGSGRPWDWNRRGTPGLPSYRPTENAKEWSVPLKASVSRLELLLEAPSLDLEARGDSDLNSSRPGTVLSAQMSWDKIEPETDAAETRGGETLRATMRSRATEGVDGKQFWQLALNPSLATSMSVSGGVTNLTLDMSSVFLESVNVASGISRLDLTLGLSGKETRINVTGGFGNVTLYVPEAAGVKITLTGVLALSNDFSKQGLTKSGGSWLTPDYENAATKVDLSMTCATGRVTLHRSSWD